MKKIYIAPNMITVAVNVRSKILEGSLQKNGDITVTNTSDAGWTKEDRGSRGGYNVWDDDWNK